MSLHALHEPIGSRLIAVQDGQQSGRTQNEQRRIAGGKATLNGLRQAGREKITHGR
jgi:hypothetical protein